MIFVKVISRHKGVNLETTVAPEKAKLFMIFTLSIRNINQSPTSNSSLDVLRNYASFPSHTEKYYSILLTDLGQDWPYIVSDNR